MPSRRQFLRAAAVALGGSVATAGCISVPASSGDPDEEQSPANATAETTNRTSTDTTTATTTADERRQRARGEADPISVEETITDSKYVYVESNDTVRYPAIKSGDEVLEYGHESFDGWARTKGAVAGLRAVRERVADRVDGEFGSGVGAGPNGSLVITLRVATRVDRDGNVVSEPSVPFSEVVTATPASATSTVHFAGKSKTHTTEVWVRETVIQND